MIDKPTLARCKECARNLTSLLPRYILTYICTIKCLLLPGYRDTWSWTARASEATTFWCFVKWYLYMALTVCRMSNYNIYGRKSLCHQERMSDWSRQHAAVCAVLNGPSLLPRKWILWRLQGCWELWRSCNLFSEVWSSLSTMNTNNTILPACHLRN